MSSSAGKNELGAKWASEGFGNSLSWNPYLLPKLVAPGDVTCRGNKRNKRLSIIPIRFTSTFSWYSTYDKEEKYLSVEMTPFWTFSAHYKWVLLHNVYDQSFLFTGLVLNPSSYLFFLLGWIQPFSLSFKGSLQTWWHCHCCSSGWPWSPLRCWLKIYFLFFVTQWSTICLPFFCFWHCRI